MLQNACFNSNWVLCRTVNNFTGLCRIWTRSHDEEDVEMRAKMDWWWVKQILEVGRFSRFVICIAVGSDFLWILELHTQARMSGRSKYRTRPIVNCAGRYQSMMLSMMLSRWRSAPLREWWNWWDWGGGKIMGRSRSSRGEGKEKGWWIIEKRRRQMDGLSPR